MLYSKNNTFVLKYNFIELLKDIEDYTFNVNLLEKPIQRLLYDKPIPYMPIDVCGGRTVTSGNKQPADSRALLGNHPLSATTVEHPAA